MNSNLINKAKFESTKNFLSQVNEFAIRSNENIHNTSDMIGKVGNIYIESKKLDNENLRLKNELVSIVSDFKIKQGYLQAIFSERSRIIDKHFEIINKGIRENNDDLILQGLKGASDFASTNPLDSFENFKNILLNNDAPLELDF